MPPKKKAKKTQTVSLDKRAQSKMLGDKASALEALRVVLIVPLPAPAIPAIAECLIENLPLTATFPNGIHRVLQVCSICLIPPLRSTNLLGVGTRPR
mgnify:CR=1 FL=1